MRIIPERIVAYLAVFLIIFFWPLNFLLHNNVSNTIHFFLPSVVITATLLLGAKSRLGKIVAFFIPLINSSLLFIPLVVLFFKSRKLIIKLLLISILIVFLTSTFKPFIGSSIFYYSWDDQQKVIQQGYLYPNIWLSRTFQNKPSIYINRFLFNFFALIDPNNYFFGFHPREITVDNQNLQKFPFLAICLFLIGLYQVAQKNQRLLLSLFLIIINLSLLRNFDKTDAILWLPLFLVIKKGLVTFQNYSSKVKILFIILFLIFTLTEYLHLIINMIT